MQQQNFGNNFICSFIAPSYSSSKDADTVDL